jgi:hypothetical protein
MAKGEAISPRERNVARLCCWEGLFINSHPGSVRARCQGDRSAESTCLIPITFTCCTESAPKIRSRSQQIPRPGFPRKGLAQLLSSPLRGRMRSEAKMQNAPPVVRSTVALPMHLSFP